MKRCGTTILGLMTSMALVFLDTGIARAQSQAEYYSLPDEANQIRGTVELQGPDQNITKLDYEVKPNGDSIFEGDIILGEIDQISQLSNNVTTLSALSDPGLLSLFRKGNHLWPKGIVRYSIDPGLTATTKSSIMKALSHWQLRTNLRFEEITGTSGNHIRFVSDPGGCSSSVGMVGGRQFIKLATACSTGNIIHEVGHAIGLGHEHIRNDRDSYITVNAQNIKPNMESQFSRKPAIYTNRGPYDYGSIMHYEKYAFSKNGQPTIVATHPGVTFGQRQGLSAGDILSVTDAYKDELANR